jgi:threonyl-tRNA synthetase
VSERHHAYAEDIAKQMRAAGLRVDIDRSQGHLKAMIRDAQLAKVPYTLVVGDKEVESRSVSPRKHGTGKDADLGITPFDKFLESVTKEAEIPY